MSCKEGIYCWLCVSTKLLEAEKRDWEYWLPLSEDSLLQLPGAMGSEQPRAAELCRSCLPSSWSPGFQMTATLGLKCGCIPAKENHLAWHHSVTAVPLALSFKYPAGSQKEIVLSL